MSPVRRWLREELRLLSVAVQFLTRIAVPERWILDERVESWSPQWLNDCVRYFPLVGGLVGAIGGAALCSAATLLPPLVAALLAVLCTAVVTGAFHEDGLADTFDALGGAVSRERSLEIMKDSRIGTFGALALGLITTLRVATLSELSTRGAFSAALVLLWAHSASRAASVVVMVQLPYAGDVEHAKAKPLATQVPRGQALRACASLALIAGGVLFASASLLDEPARVAWAMSATALAAAATTLAMQRWLKRRLGGYTGDTLGATQQIAESFGLTAALGALTILARA